MSHTYTSILIHVIFSTKDRVPLLDVGIRSKLHAYLHGIARNLEAAPLAVGGVEDHVHLFATIPPKISVSEFAGKLKANSSRWINETYRNRGRFNWQEGYSVFSVSPVKQPTVINYIQTQEEHHRKVTFAEELEWFLKNHGLLHDNG